MHEIILSQSIDFILLVVAETSTSTKSGISKGAIAGIVLGGIAAAVTLSAIVSLLILRMRSRDYHTTTRKRRCECLIIIIGCLHKYVIIFPLLFPLLLVLTSVDVLLYLNIYQSILEIYVGLFVFIVV